MTASVFVDERGLHLSGVGEPGVPPAREPLVIGQVDVDDARATQKAVGVGFSLVLRVLRPASPLPQGYLGERWRVRSSLAGYPSPR